jgi:hypothetical protein
MQFSDTGPCTGATYSLQLVIALGVIVNTLLASWLAHRRALADKRENGRAHGPSNPPSVVQERHSEGKRDGDGGGRHET